MTSGVEYPGREGYRSTDKAARYAARSGARNRAEADLLNALLEGFPPPTSNAPMTVLDAPAGTGRMARHLRRLGHHVVKADMALEMLRHGSNHPGSDDRFLEVSAEATQIAWDPAVQADVVGMLPFRDRAFDLVLCWRFLHHLPDEDRLGITFKELARVSRRGVIVSFFHPCSLHALERRIKGLFGGRKSARYARSLKTIRRLARSVGLKLQAHRAQLPYLKDLWAAAFVKK